MKIHTPFTRAAAAASRWEAQNLDGKEESQCGLKVHQELLALGEFPHPFDVDLVIGNNGWTTVPRCSECDEQTSWVLEVGEPPGYESETAYLCKPCVGKAAAILEASL